MEETTRFYFEKQLLFSLQHQRYYDCPYYPCHNIEQQNCFFCYCPFYPCEDKTKGVWLFTEKSHIWDCSPCNWIHQEKIVKTILTLIYENKNTHDIKNSLIEDNLW